MSRPRLNIYVNLVSSLGSRIREARLASGISQEDLAEQVEVVTQTMSRLENDKQMPSALLLWKIAKILSKPMEWFMEGEEPEADPLEAELARIGVKLENLENLPREVIQGMLDEGRFDWLRSLAMGKYQPGESAAKVARRRK